MTNLWIITKRALFCLLLLRLVAGGALFGMDLDQTQAYVLKIGQYFFAHLKENNFTELFKLTTRQAARFLLYLDVQIVELEVRDFLLFLFWSRHYLPMRVLGVLFHLGKSSIHRIIREQLTAIGGLVTDFVNLGEVTPLDEFVLPNAVGIVDATEIYIERKDSSTFYSGKKKRYTVKYQVVTDIETGFPIHISGPFPGSVHDANMYEQSLIGYYLASRDYFVLGDKGYEGCMNCYFMRKRKKHQAVLPQRVKDYNNTISEKRVEIEQFFGSLKDWKVINHVFRGDLSSHKDIFCCCIVFAHFSKL